LAAPTITTTAIAAAGTTRWATFTIVGVRCRKQGAEERRVVERNRPQSRPAFSGQRAVSRLKASLKLLSFSPRE